MQETPNRMAEIEGPTPNVDSVFALDIGTRTIVGLLADQAPAQSLKVVDVELVAHDDRSMRDGQVQDIPEVGRRIAQVVARLRARSGRPLTRAAVAAAGRALRTVEAAHCADVPLPGLVQADFLRSLAISAVRAAVSKLGDANDHGTSSSSFHCVGYSIVRHRLDGEIIGNPLGQRGGNLEAEVIATFLPRSVTDGLVGALAHAGLDVASLTLEPIAAAAAAIPPTMRTLNVALVDIGAGTSDIALTSEGSVVGYGMVPMAGDALTEALSQAYLLDFPQAEQLKIALGTASLARAAAIPSRFFEATDILGTKLELGPAELQSVMDPLLEDLARRVSREILKINGKAPAAVICIGGGSLSPGLPAAISRALGLPLSRVGTRDAQMVKAANLEGLTPSPAANLLAGPAGVTPLGIALGSLYNPGFRFKEAWVSCRGESVEILRHLRVPQRVQVLDLGRASVLDALVAAAIPAHMLARPPGLGIAIYVNGTLRLFPGRPGVPAAVQGPSGPLDFEDPLPEGAHLTFNPALEGGACTATTSSIVDFQPIKVRLDGEPRGLVPRVTVDGTPAGPDVPLPDGARVLIRRDVGTLLAQEGIRLPRSALSYTLDGIAQQLPLLTTEITINGVPGHPDCSLAEGDEVRVKTLVHPIPRIVDVISHEHPHTVRLTLNSEAIDAPIAGFQIRVNGMIAPPDTLLGEGDDLRVEVGAAPIVADLLSLIQSELLGAAGPGKTLQLRLDGAPAQFTSPLHDGVRLEARWVEIQPHARLS